jgi:hypothetical protein
MASFKFLENDFTGGQVSPLLNKRSNAARHKTGLDTLQNMTIMLQGGITTRPATEHVAQVKDSSLFTKLIDFEFSVDDAYAIEMGDQYFRFCKESGQILEADKVITAITAADPPVVTATAHGYTNGDQIYITEVVGMTEINHDRVYYTVSNKTTNTFEVQDQDGVDVDASAFTAYSSGGVCNKIYEIASSYLEADIDNIAYDQSNDTMTLVHETYAPADLTRTADTSWTLTDKVFVDGPYLTENTTATTLGISGTGASTITITASGVTGINGDTGFQTTDVGRLIRWQDPGSTWHYYQVDTRSSTTVVVCTRLSDATPSATTATEVWRLGSWSDTTGYPKAIAYHQQRLFFAGTTDEPNTIWGSAIDDFTNFTPGTDDSDAVKFVVAGKRNDIYWMKASDRLRIGSAGGIQTLWGGSTTSSITPTNVDADNEETIRCKRLNPIDLGKVTLFAQRSGKVLRELSFDAIETDGLVAPDVTLVSEDILGNPGDTTDVGVKQMAFQREPVPTVWCVKDNGQVAGLTYSRETETVGWHNHIIGGDTAVSAKSVVSIPGTGQDRVWFINQRTINGTVRQYIEQMNTNFRGTTVKNAKFADSFIYTSGEEPAATLTPAATTGSSITFTAGSAVFAATDVGRIIQNGQYGGKALITAYTDTTHVDADILRDFTDTSAIAAGSWTLSKILYDKLDHLEGETVSILADGGVQPQQTVTNGAVTLANQYTDVCIGLGFTQEFELLDIDFGSDTGTAYGSKSKVNEVVLDFFESMGGAIGYDSSKLTDIVFRDGTNLMNEGVPLSTGEIFERPIGGWQDSNSTLFRNTDPLPSTVLGMVVKGQVSDQTG